MSFKRIVFSQFEEDVSEEATLARHSRSEELERKKFLQHLHMQVTSRSSRSRRTDSSGTNTPGGPLVPRFVWLGYSFQEKERRKKMGIPSVGIPRI